MPIATMKPATSESAITSHAGAPTGELGTRAFSSSDSVGSLPLLAASSWFTCEAMLPRVTASPRGTVRSRC